MKVDLNLDFGLKKVENGWLLFHVKDHLHLLVTVFFNEIERVIIFINIFYKEEKKLREGV